MTHWIIADCGERSYVLYSIFACTCSGRICHGDRGTLNARIALRTTLQLEVTDGEYRAQVKECTPTISDIRIDLGSRVLRYYFELHIQFKY